MNLRFQLLFSHIVWFEYDSECQVPLGLRSNRFQSSYGAKVRAGAKKNKVEVGEEGEKRTFFKIVEFAGKRFLISPPCPPSFLYFFAVFPTFLGELARKRLLRRLSSAVSIPVSKGGAVSSFCVRNLSRIPLLCCLTLPLQVCIESTTVLKFSVRWEILSPGRSIERKGRSE